jgi:ribosomal protein S18 acetylase RimI-like enzyme
MKIRESTEKDFTGIMKVVRALHPKWFNNFAINKSIPLDLKIHKGFIGEEKGKVLGFITYTSKDGMAELSWIGVDPKLHRQGIGTKLFNALEKELKRLGIRKLQVDTVADSEESEPYRKTRLFYRKVGFRVERVRKAKSEDTGEEFEMATFSKEI